MEAAQDIPFERIGSYRVVRRLATGGTSDVLLAKAEGPLGFERTVVLKLLLSQFRRDPSMEKMFAREAAAYARLSHPAIVKLYEFFADDGRLVMALEFVDGLPLNRLRMMMKQAGENLDDRASIFVASRVFAALAAAHGARDPDTGEFAPVIHRDVNPSNVLLPWDGHVKLADFGIAKVAGVSSDTLQGYIKGTYGYMAPEQVRGEPVTVRADVYAATLLLWELLARRKAVQRGAMPDVEVMRAMADPKLPSLDVLRADLPRRLREAVARGLEPSQDARSITAEEMLVILRESVTSNEGRNVLVDTLTRARAGGSDGDLAKTYDRAPSSGEQSAASPAPPSVRPPPSQQKPVKPAQIVAVGPPPPKSPPRAATPPLGVVAPPPPASSPQRQMKTLGFGGAREDSAPSIDTEHTGGYRSIVGRGSSPDKVEAAPPRAARFGGKTMFGVAPPPPQEAAPSPRPPHAMPGAAMQVPTVVPGAPTPPPSAVSSMPPVFGVPAPAAMPAPDSMPAILALPPPSPMKPQSAPSPLAPPVMPAAAPMSVPLSSAPPPPRGPMGSVAPFNPFRGIFSSTPEPLPEATAPVEIDPTPPPTSPSAPPAAHASPPLLPLATAFASLPPARTPVQTPTPMPTSPQRILTSTDSAMNSEARHMPTIHREPEPKRGAYVLIAGVALLASAVVAAFLFAQRAESRRPGEGAGVPAIGAHVVAATATVAASVTATQAAPATTPASTAPAAAAKPASASASAPASAPAPAAKPSSDSGDVLLPSSSAGHRVFVDGKVAGQGPEALHLKCGPHTIKIGSSGASRKIDVPCGGQVAVVGH